jgi:hypothetical protein
MRRCTFAPRRDYGLTRLRVHNWRKLANNPSFLHSSLQLKRIGLRSLLRGAIGLLPKIYPLGGFSHVLTVLL